MLLWSREAGINGSPFAPIDEFTWVIHASLLYRYSLSLGSWLAPVTNTGFRCRVQEEVVMLQDLVTFSYIYTLQTLPGLLSKIAPDTVSFN